MSVAVHFYEFSKRENSTKRPGSSGTTANCNLKDGCGLIAPIIEIMYTGNPTAFNYAYVEDFARYYYVSDWTYYRGLWSAKLNVDVLASWKNMIGSSTQYVLRSSHSFDGTIVDALYPARSSFEYVVSEFMSPFVDSLSEGCFALKVVNDAANAGPRTYLLTREKFGEFMNFMYGTISWANISASEISESLQKGLINPFQYVVSCTWLPLPVSSVWGGAANIKFGYWDSGISAKTIPVNASAEGEITLDLSLHPQFSTRGEYLNLEPYTRRTLYFPVLGMIPVDTSMIAESRTIKLSWHLDMCTGEGTLEVFGIRVVSGISVPHLMNVLKYRAGVPIQVSQLSQDLIGGVSSVVSAAGSVASAFAGNVAGGIAGGISGIGSAIESMLPHMQTNGTTGSFADYMTSSVNVPKLISQFTTLVDDDYEDRGRPLCKMLTISSIPGYILVADADIAIPGTSEENTAIKGYLENGFFYE